MKIDKNNIHHWLYLCIFSINTLLAFLLRPLQKPNPKPKVILYGHKLNGNLKSLYDHIHNDNKGPDITLHFLTMDPVYYRILKREGSSAILATKPECIKHLIKTDCIISDHGLHSLELLLKLSNIKFIDVWHGIPFKGFDKNDFKIQHQYDQVWVSSKKLKQLYTDNFGFNKDKIKVTGYGRTDLTLKATKNRTEIKAKLGLPQDNRKIILFAPTWQQDKNNRNIFPFHSNEDEFYNLLENICEKTNAIALIRTHLNTKETQTHTAPPLYSLPHAKHPNTEEILAISDLLVCDWSSIAFDFLILDRPTIFLDVPAPFDKGFSLGPEYRFGEIVKTTTELKRSIKKYLPNIHSYQKHYIQKHNRVKSHIYDNLADGKSAARYKHELLKQIKIID